MAKIPKGHNKKVWAFKILFAAVLLRQGTHDHDLLATQIISVIMKVLQFHFIRVQLSICNLAEPWLLTLNCLKCSNV